jgi:two-component system sensor histidine kinase/response regulator
MHSLADSAGQERVLNVLLVEDNAVNRTLIIQLLKQRGHEVVLARNGAEALAAVQEHNLDAVLMDVHMPEMDGFQATAAIRKSKGRNGRYLPIVGLIAHATRDDHDRCLDAGMDGYLTKPIRPPDLYSTLDRLVSANRNGAPKPASSD